jgi:glycosyltransferase involved in cell wall biosynthesis
MNNKPIKVFFSFGIGRLHFTNLIPELVKKNLKITIVQGWTPKKISPIVRTLMDKFFKRKNTHYGLGKRASLLSEVDNAYSIVIPEVIQKILFRFFGKTEYRGSIAVLTWKLFGSISARYLDESYDVCHIRSGAGHKIIDKAKKLGIPVVVDQSIIHPNDAENNLLSIFKEYNEPIRITLKNPFWKQVISDCVNADVILVNSYLVRDSLQKNGMAGKNIQVAYLGISDKFIGKKKDWNLVEAEKLKIVFTGTFSLRKGIKDIFKALKILEERGIAYELHVFGAIDVPIELQSIVATLNIKPHGFIPQEDLISHLVDSDLYLFPTLAEGSANSLLEAMAIGLPVITTNFSGGPIEHKENGLLVNIHSPDEIATAILLLKEDKGLRTKLGENASKEISETCTWENCTSILNKVYQDAILKSQ